MGGGVYMSRNIKHVVHLHSVDGGGGGGIFAYNLMVEYRKLGIDSELYVKRKLSENIYVKYLTKRIEIANKLANLFPLPRKLKSGIWLLISKYTSLKIIASSCTGKEYKCVYGAEKYLKNILKHKPDIIHCHNLHSNYFDLSVLINISQQIPTVISLHDAWMLTGHCAHFFDCMRWKEGCGQCPYLSTYPAIRKDATAFNWRERAEIYKQCNLYVITPCQWLMDNVHQSILEPGIVKSVVIPYGIDLNIFHPGDKHTARTNLSLPLDRFIVVFSASGLKKSQFKDYITLRKCLDILASADFDVLCLALGDKGDTEYLGESVELRFIPFITDPHIVARYYQAADVYVHPAKAETFGLVIVEAEACGTPVIASAVGGIPELIINGKTGYVVPSGDAQELAQRIIELKTNDNLRCAMGVAASILAKEKYDQKFMVDKYLTFYRDIIYRDIIK